MVKTLPSNAEAVGSIPGWGAKIPHASRPENQNTKQKQYCNKSDKDFKNGPCQKKILEKKIRAKEKKSIELLKNKEIANLLLVLYFRKHSGFLVRTRLNRRVGQS